MSKGNFITLCALSNALGAILNCFGACFDVMGLVIAGGVFIIGALVGLVIVIISEVKEWM